MSLISRLGLILQHVNTEGCISQNSEQGDIAETFWKFLKLCFDRNFLSFLCSYFVADLNASVSFLVDPARLNSHPEAGYDVYW